MPPTTLASCHVEPAEPESGVDYEVIAEHLLPERLYRVLILEQLGTQSGSNYTDENGVLTMNARSFHPGDATAEVREATKKNTLVTSCTFTIT